MELKNLKVLITKPSPAGYNLCALIEQHDGKPTYFPTIEITPITPPAETDLNKFKKLIFISRNAVIHSKQLLENLKNHPKIFAVGPATCDTLKSLAIDQVTTPDKDFTTQGLLALKELNSIKDEKIAIIKGEGGLDILHDSLKERGAHVKDIIVYKRSLPKNPNTVALDMLREKKIDIIVCTSLEILQNLLFLTRPISLQNVPLLVVSERIKVEAKKLGFTRIYLANNASQSVIIAKLIELKDQLCQAKIIKK